MYNSVVINLGLVDILCLMLSDPNIDYRVHRSYYSQGPWVWYTSHEPRGELAFDFLTLDYGTQLCPALRKCGTSSSHIHRVVRDRCQVLVLTLSLHWHWHSYYSILMTHIPEQDKRPTGCDSAPYIPTTWPKYWSDSTPTVSSSTSNANFQSRSQ